MKDEFQEAVGPGAIEQKDIAPDPMLQGATNAEYVTLLNPLPVTFKGQVGQTRPVNAPFEIHKDGVVPVSTNDESDMARNYGLNLKNPDHQGKTHITRTYEIGSGRTLTLPGGDAQVIIKQLVTAILQYQKKKLQLADPHERHQIEEQIVVKRGFMSDYLDTPIQTPDQQVEKAINEMNQEQEFPDAAPVSVPTVKVPAPAKKTKVAK